MLQGETGMKKITNTKKSSNFDNKIKLVRKNNLLQEFVLVDGVGSSGKGMLSHILASFKRVEKQRNDMIFDTIPRIYMLGKISFDAASTLMITEADQQLYHTMMSRAVNFRFKDSTGVFQNPGPFRYIHRLFMKEGDTVVERIKNEKPIFQNAPHDALRNSKLFFDVFGNKLKIVYILRDPIEIIYDWHKRGFGDRIGVDPREFQFSIEYKDNIVPLYAYGWEDDYIRLDPIDRNIRMVYYHFKGNMESYNKLTAERQKKVMLILFDELVSNPIPICERIANFLGTKITHQTKKTLKHENCPRIISQDEKKLKRKKIEQKATKKYLKTFYDLINNYEKIVKTYSENNTNI